MILPLAFLLANTPGLGVGPVLSVGRVHVFEVDVPSATIDLRTAGAGLRLMFDSNVQGAGPLNHRVAILGQVDRAQAEDRFGIRGEGTSLALGYDIGFRLNQTNRERIFLGPGVYASLGRMHDQVDAIVRVEVAIEGTLGWNRVVTGQWSTSVSLGVRCGYHYLSVNDRDFTFTGYGLGLVLNAHVFYRFRPGH